ncbi:TATA-binding protein-associated factor mot1 [Lobulomyces angularis]|nr:TATA-binding protein-associated factor mot1 [Lobulomyces angularis]
MTRLDRLVLLLETGSTSAVRLTAAKQLGEIQKQHPEELYSLISRVVTHLRSKNWETRVAAGQAIEAICANVTLWDPLTGTDKIDLEEYSDGLFNFESFDIESVVKNGAHLVASAGKEFDAGIADMDPKERIALQKKQLKQKLGLGTEFMDVDFFTEADISHSDEVINAQPIKKEAKMLLEESRQIVPKVEESNQALSARERNLLKRKKKLAAKGQKEKVQIMDISSSSTAKKRQSSYDDSAPSKTGMAVAVKKEKNMDEEDDLAPTESSLSDHLSNKVVVEHKPKEVQLFSGSYGSGDEWPFEGLAEQLCLDLFAPNWEVRHGAAIGLREVLKLQGSGAGKVVGPSKAENEMMHKKRLEDIAIRLLCVLALDRFADFVSDQVVVPVRETAAQTLGVLLKWCDEELCRKVMYNGLLKLIELDPKKGLKGDDSKARWEIRHAGLIGLKYWMAVRTDLVGEMIVSHVKGEETGVFKAIINGLSDSNDDVRAVSSSTLLPVTSILIDLLPTEKIFGSVVTTLWDCLQDLDDLTSATSSVMELLSQFLMQPAIVEVMTSSKIGLSLEVLAPRLFPFFRHAISSVRVAVLKMVETLVDVGMIMLQNKSFNGNWVGTELLRLVFQNFLLEENPDILKRTFSLWKKLISFLIRKNEKLPNTLSPLLIKDLPEKGGKSLIAVWFTLLMTPIGHKLDINLFYNHQSKGKFSKSSEEGLNVSVHDKAMAAQDLRYLLYNFLLFVKLLRIISQDDVIRGRITAATALGIILCSLSATELFYNSAAESIVFNFLQGHLGSSWASHRVFSSIIIDEWAGWYEEIHAIGSALPLVEKSTLIAKLCELMLSELIKADCGTTLLYEELIVYLYQVRQNVLILFNLFSEYGVNSLPPIPPFQGQNSVYTVGIFGPIFTVELAEYIVTEYFSQIIQTIPNQSSSIPTKTQPNPPDRHTLLYDKCRQIRYSIDAFNEAQQRCEARVLGCISAAVVKLGKIPGKLNPVIRSLMNCIKFEEHKDFQRRGAYGVSRLLELNIKTNKPVAVNEKIIKNLGMFLCSDPEIIGDVRQTRDSVGILTLRKMDDNYGKEVEASVSKNKRKDKIQALKKEELQVDKALLAEENETQKKSRILVRRGAELSFQMVFERFGSKAFELCPKLLNLISLSIQDYNLSDDLLQKVYEKVLSDEIYAQEVVDTLFTIGTVVPYIHHDLYPALVLMLKPLCTTLKTPLAVVRSSSSISIASMAKVVTLPTMQAIIENVLPLLGDTKSVIHRQGAAECVYHIIKLLEHNILPYIIFLIVPILGRMSDSDESVRFLSTHIFAQLIKLVPLESGVPDPVGIPQELVEQRKEERKFLGQLVGTEKVENFELCVEIKAELRPYQKEGVSWLAFLNRYGLHGILCDDMGLGKTLQSICMLASDHNIRAEKFAKTQSPDSCPTPSLVVCPPTLVQHWFHEIANYAGFMKAIIYAGNPGERQRIRKQLLNFDVVITSYEVLRNDVDEIAKNDWNYCILDEGHIIKNTKTKLTKAVKTVKAMKRIILSGTPIQNSVLELWSLFDFLMPGFLGTERQFNERFGKPILNSRDAKSSSKEQEQGALALEALHRQVLPFVLRRMKEDVLHDLPPKIIQDYECELSDLQKMLYEEFGHSQARDGVEDAFFGEEEEPKKKKGGQHVFQALNYLKKLCNHPSLVLTPEHPQYEKVIAKVKADKSNLTDLRYSPKLMALQQLLQDCSIGSDSTSDVATVSPHRALIFCQMKQTMDLIEHNLFKNLMPNVTFMRMDGSVEGSKRHDIVTKFNADPSIDVLLLTTSVGGLGLNLTGADTVIFVEHDWNPMKDLQAMDRAHRIGQKKVVNVYRLITRGTLEEKIMGLQKFKLNIASAVINQENSGLKSMDTEQILDLFSLGPGQEDSKKKKMKEKGKQTTKDIIDSLDGLWDESQYEEFGVGEFLKNLS